MDKIYSRRRIKIPKIKLNKMNLLIFILLSAIIISIVSFIYASYPILIASCESAAGSRITHIVTEEVNNVMNNYTYNELIDIEKDNNGNITLMKSNVILINKITSTIINNIQTQIDNSPQTKVYINYGSVSGISILKFIGPQFDINLETAGRIQPNIKSEFESKRSKSNYT